MKVVTILGARPQFIKAATLSRVFRKYPDISEVIIHTGQHYDKNMSDVFFEEMDIPHPNYFLKVMSKYHGEMTGKMLEGIERILLDEKPNVVLVYGDTNSTLAGALAASKLHIPIAHVEAGLRSFNRRMPEEINRILTDHVSEWLFSPTQLAINNLTKEGVDSLKIHQVGDVMYDAVLHYQRSHGEPKIIQTLGLDNKDFILVTIHRAENTNDLSQLEQILNQLNEIGKEKVVVFPMHPRTKNIISSQDLIANITVIDPIGYFDMLHLQKKCKLIVTDSGGVQKEAFFNNKYCITVREETEWVELVDAGFNFLAKPTTIVPLVKKLFGKPFNAGGFQPYGEGDAAEKIVNILKLRF